MEAREGNPTLLARRLRGGVSLSQTERDFLADLIEGKIKPRKSRPTKLGETITARGRLEIVKAVIFIEAINPKWQRKTIIPDVCSHFGVSRRFVVKLLDETDPEQLKAISSVAAAYAKGMRSGT
jgi:hypothetical protein